MALLYSASSVPTKIMDDKHELLQLNVSSEAIFAIYYEG